jgi:hypothetical protein
VYLDGDESDVPLASLRLGVFGPGLAVSVNWKGKRAYYNGTIVGRIGAAVQIVYDTGEKEWATISQCRIRQEVAASLSAMVAACVFCGGGMSVNDARCSQCGAPRGGRA